jgi:hypothetical protein
MNSLGEGRAITGLLVVERNLLAIHLVTPIQLLVSSQESRDSTRRQRGVPIEKLKVFYRCRVPTYIYMRKLSPMSTAVYL